MSISWRDLTRFFPISLWERGSYDADLSLRTLTSALWKVDEEPAAMKRRVLVCSYPELAGERSIDIRRFKR
jgi:hypothetical protein